MSPTLDVERPTGWMWQRGSLGVLTLGPLSVAVNTADGYSFHVAIRIWRRWVLTWGVENAMEDPSDDLTR